MQNPQTAPPEPPPPPPPAFRPGVPLWPLAGVQATPEKLPWVLTAAGPPLPQPALAPGPPEPPPWGWTGGQKAASAFPQPPADAQAFVWPGDPKVPLQLFASHVMGHVEPNEMPICPAPTPPCVPLQPLLVPAAPPLASPPFCPGVVWLAPAAPGAPVPPSTSLLVSVTTAPPVTVSVMAGAPWLPVATDPRSLKFS